MTADKFCINCKHVYRIGDQIYCARNEVTGVDPVRGTKIVSGKVLADCERQFSPKWPTSMISYLANPACFREHDPATCGPNGLYYTPKEI